MAGNSHDLGPLPEGDRQDTLQQLSLKALRNRLPEDMFLFRREPEDDKGVDGTLELKVGGRFTNCRANAQLKSTDRPRRNSDSSVSYPVESSNLNYLLNGASPLYFLWIEPDQEMRYAWAWDEWRRLDAVSPDWREQGSFTVRFRDILSPEAAAAIHERVLKEARLGRSIHEALGRAALSERVIVSIDTKSLTSDDPARLHEWIISSGMTIVSAGYGSQVLEWMDVLTQGQRRDPRVRLVAAFALASLGQYQSAFGPLAEARAGFASLSEPDRRTLDHLMDFCQHQTGGMGRDEYLRRERQASERLSGVQAAEHRLESLRLEMLDAQDRDDRAGLLGRMRAACREILEAEEAAPAQRINARLHVLYAEADELTGRLTGGAFQTRARRDMGFQPDVADRRDALALAEDWQRWDRDTAGLIREAEAEKHPLLVAEAVTTRLTGHHAFWASGRMLAAVNEEPWEPKADLFGGLAREAERAMAIFRRAGSLEGESRAKLLLADIRHLTGDEQAARTLAEEVLVIARAWCFPRLESHAREYTDGPTALGRFLAEAAARRAQDEDLLRSADTDETLRRYALRSLEAMRLPVERLPVVEREWHSLRLIARERVSWCRHINLMQDKSHALHPATCYLLDPERFCVCGLHGTHANVRHADTEVVIGSFKRTYCEGCADRSPKGRPA